MNILYTITWPDPHDELAPRQFYEALRAGAARNNSLPGGARFPLDCPYEIGLAHSLDNPPVWLAAVLAVQVSEDCAGETGLELLRSWFGQCCPGGLPEEAALSAAPASRIKLSVELGDSFRVAGSFGTFVGEPSLEDLTLEPPAPAPEKPAPAQPPQPAGRAAQGSGAGCLRLALIFGGALTALAGLIIAAALVAAQSDPATTSSPGQFALGLLCCALPVLGLGAGVVVIGAVLPRLLKAWRKQ